MARRMPARLSGQVDGDELVLDRDHAAADVHADHARNDGERRQSLRGGTLSEPRSGRWRTYLMPPVAECSQLPAADEAPYGLQGCPWPPEARGASDPYVVPAGESSANVGEGRVL